jgi:hypothetical protein
MRMKTRPGLHFNRPAALALHVRRNLPKAGAFETRDKASLDPRPIEITRFHP